MRIYFCRPKRDKYGLGSAAGSVHQEIEEELTILDTVLPDI